VDTVVAAHFEASGTAQPLAEATLSTKLMGSITAVLVAEGATVSAGTPLVRIDAADLDAKDAQVAAGIAAAEAAFQEATAQAVRVRAMYADSAAPKAQLDAVEAGLARAKAGLAAARGSQSEVAAARNYGVIRAPFAGVVTRRFVDVGDFAAPGAPLMTVQDISRLRVVASVPASFATSIRRGTTLRVRIEGADARAVVEGTVPSAGAMYTVNAIVSNPGGRLPSGGAAALDVPTGGSDRMFLVPNAAVIREGDLTGVRVMRGGRPELRWVRVGAPTGDRTPVLSGLARGDSVAVPAARR
jgi:RND family efflux transporter MFP subunit